MPYAKLAVCLLAAACLHAQADNPDARPPVTQADIEIVRRAAQILDSPQKWNRADNRECPAAAKTYSLYCALEKATDEVSHNFEHRGAAMQEARFAIEEVAPDVNRYQHRLMDYNNDPHTTFADIQGVFWLLEKRIAVRLAHPQSSGVTKADLQVAHRLRELLDTPAKWDRADPDCKPGSKTLSLICAFEEAEKEVTGVDSDGAAIAEARTMISELDPARTKYKARLVDYNADPAVTFADLQKFLTQLEDRLAARVPK
jgi:hypothetical protein